MNGVMVEVIQFQGMCKAPCKTTRPTNICTSILLVRECKKMTYSGYKHLDTQYKILKFSSFLCVPNETRLCSKKNKNTLKAKKEKNVGLNYILHILTVF